MQSISKIWKNTYNFAAHKSAATQWLRITALEIAFIHCCATNWLSRLLDISFSCIFTYNWWWILKVFKLASIANTYIIFS